MRLVCIAVLLVAAYSVGEEEVCHEPCVDGVHIDDEDALAEALGVFGVDLVTDSSRAHGKSEPSEVRLRARDIKNSRRLQRSALGYILQYGFLEVATEKTEDELLDGTTLLGKKDLAKALRKFQKFHGLKKTGTATQETIGVMSQHRCGVKDVEFVGPTRKKRYRLSRNKWGKQTLNYWFDPDKYTADLPKETTRSEFEKALALWAAAANISFTEVETEGEADIKISFDYGDHGDGYPFYGEGGTLAHAFYPTKGKLHFDDAEEFTSETVNGINLRFVATHEMGHILGLKHADASLAKAIMYPLYPGYSDELELHTDDIAGAIDALGSGSGEVVPITNNSDTNPGPTQPIPVEAPECIQSIDAAFHWDSSQPFVYLFAGSWYYRLKPKNPDGNNKLPVYDTSSPPKRIGVDGFKGLPRNIDAVVETLDDPNKFYAFKGDRYYKYDIATGKVVENGSLSDLWTSDTPDKIDGALKVNDDKLGFLVGDRLYTYEAGVWSVGEPGSNYFSTFSGLSSLSLGFYRKWTWVIQGVWYSVAKSTTGKVSSNYAYRLVKNDIKLPMCTEGVGALNGEDKDTCKGELVEMKLRMNNKKNKKNKKKKKKKNKKGPYIPSSMCKDYLAEKYLDEVYFDRNDFELDGDDF